MDLGSRSMLITMIVIIYSSEFVNNIHLSDMDHRINIKASSTFVDKYSKKFLEKIIRNQVSLSSDREFIIKFSPKLFARF